MEAPQRVKDTPFLRNVGLLLTYHCQASCAHCVIRAGPNRHEQMSLEDARTWIHEIASYRDGYVCVLSLTGGEPFSDLDLLRAVVESASESALCVSITTNASWATSREAAVNILLSLPRISSLAISTDVHHQKFVPFQVVQNAILAARECGVAAYVSIVGDGDNDLAFQRIKCDVLKVTPAENIREGITFPVGRASLIQARLQYTFSETPPNEACQAASSPCIFPDGRVYGCIGPLIDLQDQHPLLLGNLHESSLCDVLDSAETNAVLHALRIWGPHKLITMLREAGFGAHLPARYVEGSVCGACFSVMSDPAVREWLGELEKDAAFRRRVAYARLYYLNETGMLEVAGQEVM
ncbi:MAG TPA: radical SAM protein [Bryobacteraceae bacterium]|nr:radical SAM protein [Bryobacteraceae bacterium]